MECKCYLQQFLWSMVIFQLSLLSVTIGDTAMQNVPEGIHPDYHQNYAWSPWSSWSPCSRSCGGGVSVQKRYCLPRNHSLFLNTTLPPPIITVRVTRQVENCAGVAKRYHECNTAPCPGSSRDSRAEQCSVYDRRPFRGRFYTWVPYIDGNAPCVLNCRPLGQHFYASLALVADGTPCTKPGVRAICVQGSCNVVGLESVLAAVGDTELSCGHRLVSGLFTRPRLPLGYTYVTTVPRGACRLNITELVASENFIALKVSNGSYIINGDFAISAPGTFEAAGARFLYARTAGRDRIYSMGPIYNPIDIMVLFTQPAPNIRYEYLAAAISGEMESDSFTKVNATDLKPPIRHTRRHHSPRYAEHGTITDIFLNHFPTKNVEKNSEENQIGIRRFTWKVLSFSPCTRSCGGGFQIGKYRCVEAVDKEVSPFHCVGSSPSSRRRRCNNAACPARWRTAAWTNCPTCGPANRTRIVGCVQDHAKGIIKIKDRNCPNPKPHTSELCKVPDCQSFEPINLDTIINLNNDLTDNFREGPVYSVAVNKSTSADIGPEYNMSPTIDWIYTEWSVCVGSCGFGGVQSRAARCVDPAGCAALADVGTVRACEPPACRGDEGQWLTGEWSPCTSECGGWQTRGVVCAGEVAVAGASSAGASVSGASSAGISGAGASGAGASSAGAAGAGAAGVRASVLPESACRGPKPAARRFCGRQCVGRHAWYYSDWNQCKGNCSLGIGWQQRSVLCALEGEETEERVKLDTSMVVKEEVGKTHCAGAAPDRRQPCALQCARKVTSPSTDVSERSYLPWSTTAASVTPKISDCEDRLSNCGLAVQARLCHYNYYTKNCCKSCRGRN